MNIKGQSFLKLLDFTPEQITDFLTLAADLKAKKKAGIPHRLCEGKQAALIFEKTSTRTRCSFEVAAHDLGMTVTYLDPSGSQIGKKESIADTARVLGRMYDGIEYRGYEQQIVEELAKYAGVPVWNGLTNEFHPTQILADYLTKKGVPFRSAYKISGQLVAYCIAHDTVLEKLPLETYKTYSDVFTDDLYEEISLRTCVARRISAGGTGPASVQAQLDSVAAFLAAHQ